MNKLINKKANFLARKPMQKKNETNANFKGVFLEISASAWFDYGPFDYGLGPENANAQ